MWQNEHKVRGEAAEVLDTQPKHGGPFLEFGWPGNYLDEARKREFDVA
jgi:hypothetical protein